MDTLERSRGPRPPNGGTTSPTASSDWRRPSVASYDGLFPGREPPTRRDSVRRRLLAVADIAALIAAYGCAFLVLPPAAHLGDRLILMCVLPSWVVMNKLLGLYDRDANLIHKSTLDELPRITLSVVLGTTLVFMLSQPLLGFESDRPQAFAFVGFALVTVPVFRGLVRSWVARHYPPERCLIVGSGFVANLLARKIEMHPEYGVKLMGFVDLPHPEHEIENGNSNGNGDAPGLLGGLDRFEEVSREHLVERVVIAFSTLNHEDLINVIRAAKALNLKISVVPRLFEVIGHSVEVDQLEGMTLLGLRGFTRTRSSMAFKRLIDVVGSGLGLLLLSPVLAAIAVAIKLSSRGPVLFSQERIGRRNRPFSMVKFRTMVDGADALKAELEHLNESVAPMFKITDDPRVTPLGRFLRRFSLDELPQLWNVLRGEMSLVGPRPLVPSEDGEVIGYHRERLDLTPGLTGPWQVLGRTAIPFQDMVKLDYLYVAEWSLWNDIKLLIRTAPVIVRANGR
jgi:exopolysaccharide biosynthesis polyprenyl glycosylphosphotransferase